MIEARTQIVCNDSTGLVGLKMVDETDSRLYQFPPEYAVFLASELLNAVVHLRGPFIPETTDAPDDKEKTDD